MRWRPGFLAGALVLIGTLALPAVAVAAPTINESFSPASIQLTATATLTFTITGADAVPPALSFDDTLPAGLAVVAGSQGTTCLGTASGGTNDLDPNGPGIASCTGDVSAGSLIDTSKAGPHTFTVTATSKDGGIATDIAFYSVAPDNTPTGGTQRTSRLRLNIA